MTQRQLLLRLSVIGLATTVLLVRCGSNPTGSCPTGTTGGVTTVSYSRDIVPLLTVAGCLTSACHGGTFASSNYDQRTYASSFVRGDEAARAGLCEIVPGQPQSSYYFEKISVASPRSGLRMPLERDPLTADQIALIQKWITEGAQNN